MLTLTCQESARHLLAQGFEELAQGDPRKASEKGWGATAQMIKAVAADRNWDHNTHASLHRVIARLAKGTGDDSIRNWFRSANALHQNIYENWGDADYVAGGLRDVRDLLDRLEPLLDHQGTHPQATT